MTEDAPRHVLWETEHSGPHGAKRFGEPYEHGSVLGRVDGRQQAVLTYELVAQRVVIKNVLIEDPAFRRRGGASALFEELEAQYPGPPWRLAIDDTQANS